MVPSLLSDIVDYSTWKFGRERAAAHFSVFTFLNKAAGALGGAVGLALTARYAFDATATTHTEETIIGLRLSVAWLPAALTLLSIVFISNIPMNERRHAILKRRIDSRAIRAARSQYGDERFNGNRGEKREASNS